MSITIAGKLSSTGRTFMPNFVPDPLPDQIGVFMGGRISGGYSNKINQINIATEGNATNFGNLSGVRSGAAGCSNGSSHKGVAIGGTVSNPSGQINTMEYFTISTPAAGHTFGELEQKRYVTGAASNGTNDRMFNASGYTTTNADTTNVIYYYTVSTGGAAVATAELDAATGEAYPAVVSNGTNDRAVIQIGRGWSTTQYMTISTSSGSVLFGNLTFYMYSIGATSNDTNERGILASGWTSSAWNVIQYLNISTLGDTIDFGDLAEKRLLGGGTLSNATDERAVFAGGWNNDPSTTYYNLMEYVTISTTGHAQEFGFLPSNQSGSYLGAASNSSA